MHPLWGGLLLAQREILLFVAVFFFIGTLDELLVDFLYLRVRLRRRHELAIPIADDDLAAQPLSGPVAVFIPAWREANVIAATINHALGVWRHDELTLYVGCYRNDVETLASAMTGGRGDPRLRIVVHDAAGPTTKSDCLNRLWRALVDDEERRGRRFAMVMMQDAEDMVDPAALAICSSALANADMVQLPVLALPQWRSRWIATHYSDEFAEAHAKTLVVRDALGAGIPGAGVGCAISRDRLASLALDSGTAGPFAPHALTEDYELGLRIAAMGGVTRFVRARAADGRLIATRAFFPSTLSASIRQKTRWVHGIALQGWDRLGWSGALACKWMQLRDRSGPLAAFVLALAYLLVLTTAAIWVGELAGLPAPEVMTPFVDSLLVANFVFVLWRAAVRAYFASSEYGWRHGLWSVPRLFVGNLIAVLAGRRAMAAYIATLRGAPPVWDKTDHVDHPVFAPLAPGVPA